jgi:hypothetical protein
VAHRAFPVNEDKSYCVYQLATDDLLRQITRQALSDGRDECLTGVARSCWIGQDRPTKGVASQVGATVSLEGLAAERRLIGKLDRDNFSWDIIGGALIRGKRDIEHQSTPYAVADLVGNTIHASAQRIDIIFSFDADATPSRLAVMDDRHVMEPEMVSAAT